MNHKGSYETLITPLHTHRTAHLGYFSEERAKMSIRTISRRTPCVTRHTRTRGVLFPTALEEINEFREHDRSDRGERRFHGSEKVCGRQCRAQVRRKWAGASTCRDRRAISRDRLKSRPKGGRDHQYERPYHACRPCRETELDIMERSKFRKGTNAGQLWLVYHIERVLTFNQKSLMHQLRLRFRPRPTSRGDSGSV